MDALFDSEHCGACGNVCTGGKGCFAGVCTRPSAMLGPSRSLAGVARSPDDKIYVVGGCTKTGCANADALTDSVQVYDPAMNRWEELEPLPPPKRCAMPAVVRGGDVFALGGWVGSDSSAFHLTSAVHVLDGSTGHWQKRSALPLPLSDAAGTTARDEPETLWVIGGLTEGGDRSQLEDAALSLGSGSAWQVRVGPPRPRWGARAVTGVDGRVYLLGGSTSAVFPIGPVAREVDVLDPSSGEWSTAAPMLHGRAFGAASLLAGGRILYAGGVNWKYEPSDLVQIYDPATDAWSPAAPLPFPVHDISAVTMHGLVFVIGGAAEPFDGMIVNAVLVYDPERNVWYE